MKLVGRDIAEAVHAHAVFVRGIGEGAERGVNLVGLDPHQREAGPLLGQIGIVGNAAAKIAIRHLAMVDPPVDELADQLQILQLAERPERHAGWRGRLGDGGHVFGAVIDVGPILAGRHIVRVDAQQVGDIAEQARIERFALGGGMLLDQKAPIVLHLIEPVGDA